MAEGIKTIRGPLAPAGFVQMTTLSASSALSSIPNDVKLVHIQAESQSVRWRDDGVAPTAAVGMLLAAGSTLVYEGKPSALRVIETALSAKLNVTYYI